MLTFQPDVPLRIMRHRELTYQQKAFLLWCWIHREDDERFDLLSRRQDCALKERSIRWYVQFFQVSVYSGRNRPPIPFQTGH